MGNVHVAGPNEAIVISGGCGGGSSKRYIKGGWGWQWMLVSEAQKISLEVMTLLPKVSNCETKKGVPITVTGVAQVKVMTDDDVYLQIACEQFLGKEDFEIQEQLLETFEGHLRAICGTMDVEELYQDRESFAANVRAVAATDVSKMGIKILSFTIKDLTDNQGYLDAIGMEQTARVKATADIAMANANRDACIKEQEAAKTSADVCLKNETDVDIYRKDYETKCADYGAEVNKAQTESRMAYRLQAMKEKQRIIQEDMGVDLIERQRQIEVEELEIERQEKELIHTTRLPADASAYKTQTLAEAAKCVKVKKAEGNAEKLRRIGKAEAQVIEAIGSAEASKMSMKAIAYEEYGHAATTKLVLDALPKIAKSISKPLHNVEDLTIIGSSNSTASNFTAETTKLLAELPKTVQSVTGYDITGLIGKIPGAVPAAQ